MQRPSTGASTKGPHPAAVEANPTLTNRVTHNMTYEHQSGHNGVDTGTAAPGVRQPPSVRLATADADLPSLSHGHLVGDSTRPAWRG